MSVPPKTDQDVPEPHRRTLPHLPVNEEGMRELEIWLGRLFGGRGFIRYVFKNIGKWLYVRTTRGSALTDGYGVKFDAPTYTRGGFQVSVGLQPLDPTHFTDPQILLKTEGDIGQIVLSASNNTDHTEWALQSGQMIYYLDGKQDIGYTQGGAILRYSGGGGITFYTTDSALPNAGDFIVYTNGSNNVNANSGNVEIHAGYNGGSGSPGSVTVETSTAFPSSSTVGDISIGPATGAKFRVYNHSGHDLLTVAEDSTSVLNLGSGKTFTINDGSSNPLVTYTG